MKIKTLILENFRGYKERTEIDFKTFNVIVGKNDIGKSTLLEAIDIFINDKSAINSYEKSDINVTGGSESSISIIFSDLPESLVVDTAATTTLQNEYLLREDGLLEIQKTYGASGVKKIDIKAFHPSNQHVANLLTLKIDALRAKVEELNIPEENYNGTISSSLRQAIRNFLSEDLALENTTVTIFKTSDKGQSPAKEIWGQIESYFPIYSLFQSDRKNEEKDAEVQSPMTSVIRQVIRDPELEKELNTVKLKVELASTEVANRTIEKLREMNPEIAKTLIPKFADPKWESVFKFNLLSDNNIPLDKRGSGVRRLILLNFFRAEAEKKRDSKNVPHIIYALEEPETSQHPNHQKMLIDAFKELASNVNNQIILTTHSPGIARQINPENIILLEREETGVKSQNYSDDILRRIALELGILPTIELEDVSKVKLAICVEGKNDIIFLKNLNSAVQELNEIVDLNSEDSIIYLPMGGSSLQFWVNSDYLGKLNLNQIHIYDSDIGSDQPHKYSAYADTINAKGDGNVAIETTMREMENLFSPSLINEIYGVEVEDGLDWQSIDVTELISRHNLSISESTKTWGELEKEDKKKRTSKVKNQLNQTHSSKLRKVHLDETNSFEEIANWFAIINQLK